MTMMVREEWINESREMNLMLACSWPIENTGAYHDLDSREIGIDITEGTPVKIRNVNTS